MKTEQIFDNTIQWLGEAIDTHTFARNILPANMQFIVGEIFISQLSDILNAAKQEWELIEDTWEHKQQCMDDVLSHTESSIVILAKELLARNENFNTPETI